MCGVLGFTSYGESIPSEAMTAFEEMFINTETRGKDASGFAYIHKGKLTVGKQNIPASKLLHSDEWKKAKEVSPKLMIAHCRLKTQGTEKNNCNNHPVFDPKFGWAVVHNGTIWNDDALFEKYKLKRDGQVDTEIILRMFQHYMVSNIKTSPGQAMKKAVEKIRGAMTYAMIGEEKPNHLYLYKGANPLAVVVVPEWKMVYFASKYEHIATALMKMETMCDGFFTKLGEPKAHYSNDDIKEGTLLCISIQNGEPVVRSMKAVQDTTPIPTVYQSKGRGGQYEADFQTGRFRVGVSHYQNQDGTIEPIEPRRKSIHALPDDAFFGDDDTLAMTAG